MPPVRGTKGRVDLSGVQETSQDATAARKARKQHLDLPGIDELQQFCVDAGVPRVKQKAREQTDSVEVDAQNTPMPDADADDLEEDVPVCDAQDTVMTGTVDAEDVAFALKLQSVTDALERLSL
jgi:hypothetical protein